LAASALRVRVTALNKVDLPTLGSPTIPALSMVYSLNFKFLYAPDRDEWLATGGKEAPSLRLLISERFGY
jgi:hypothetical protein